MRLAHTVYPAAYLFSNTTYRKRANTDIVLHLFIRYTQHICKYSKYNAITQSMQLYTLWYIFILLYNTLWCDICFRFQYRASEVQTYIQLLLLFHTDWLIQPAYLLKTINITVRKYVHILNILFHSIYEAQTITHVYSHIINSRN